MRESAVAKDISDCSSWNCRQHMLYFFILIRVVEPCHETHRHLSVKRREYKAGQLSWISYRLNTGNGGNRIWRNAWRGYVSCFFSFLPGLFWLGIQPWPQASLLSRAPSYLNSSLSYPMIRRLKAIWDYPAAANSLSLRLMPRLLSFRFSAGTDLLAERKRSGWTNFTRPSSSEKISKAKWK